MDDSFYSWKDVKRTPSLQAVLTTHVDDLAVVGKTEFKERLYSEMCKEFGKIAKEKLPFSHCGCRYTRTSTGLKMGQSDFASRLQPAPEPQGPDDRPLTPAEVTQLRSVIGGLMWLCSTRLDLVAGHRSSAVFSSECSGEAFANGQPSGKEVFVPRTSWTLVYTSSFSNLAPSCEFNAFMTPHRRQRASPTPKRASWSC